MEEATPKLPSVGDVVGGKYRVDRVIGRGGMGTVLAVRHLGLDEARALKLMLPRGMELPQARERFFREARAAAKLRSEHAVAVHDVGVLPDGFPYIEMELLEGSDLAQLLKRGGASVVTSAVEWIAQACDAVGEAHALGIVHRDIKPGNLFLCRTQSGRELIKVLDFGIAKTIGGADTDPTLTGTNASFGSPTYMSPEQMRGARYANPQSDIWALGVVLFELLTGRRPFLAESVTALALVVTSEPAPHPASIRATIPAEVDAIVMRCLEKDPDKRFESASALATALRASVGLTPPPPRGSMASLSGASTGLPARTPSYAGAAVPTPPISQPSQPSQGSQPSQLSEASPGAQSQSRSLPAVPIPPSAAPMIDPPTTRAPAPTRRMHASQPALAPPTAFAPPVSETPGPSFETYVPTNQIAHQHAFPPMTTSRPSVATLSSTVGEPGRPRPAFLALAVALACTLGLVIALFAWRISADDATTAPSAVAAPTPPPSPIEPTPAATEEPVVAPTPPPVASTAPSASSSAPRPVASTPPAAPASGPPGTVRGKLPSRPKTGFGGID